MTSRPSDLLLSWYDHNKRDLPWRATRDPYRIWLSEIMLQQTRVETVKDYYRRFLTLFPTVEALAKAPQEQVLKAWEGLGYYSRARNLQKAAQRIQTELDGRFPRAYSALLALPGVGAYTAGAIASIAFGGRVPAVDGNVYRVMSRFYGIREDVGAPAVQKQIRRLAQESMPDERPGDYNQALMELGATLCAPASPGCDACPWRALCDACAEGDAELLPIHEKKRPQRVVTLCVCLLTHENRVLVMKRTERMLGGLYVFFLAQEETQPERVLELLAAQGLDCSFLQTLGEARHVFTHRVWEMSIARFAFNAPPTEAALTALGARMVAADELAALPMPTAMKVARQRAAELLS